MNSNKKAAKIVGSLFMKFERTPVISIVGSISNVCSHLSGLLLSQKGIIEVEGGGKVYSTYQIRIKKGHRFYH